MVQVPVCDRPQSTPALRNQSMDSGHELGYGAAPIHLSAQNLAVAPFPITMWVEVKNRDRSSSLKMRSRSCHGLDASVRGSQSQRI